MIDDLFSLSGQNNLVIVMLCNNRLRFVFIQVGIRNYTEGRLFSYSGRSLNATRSLSFPREWKLSTLRNMMVDTGATTKGGPIGDVSPEKEDDSRYASGGWKR